LAEPEAEGGEWLYVSGSPDYDEDNFDWAALREGSYLPPHPDLPSTLIGEAVNMARSSGSPRRIETAAGLFLAAATVRAVCERLFAEMAPDSPAGIPVVVGWDNADAIRIGVVTPSGFIRD
jgi:hypothetical protein